MITTPVSLLARLRSGNTTESWNRFVHLYTPLIFQWVRSKGISADDAADIVQDVFAVLVRKLASFEYDAQGSFGRWLRTVTVNKCRDHFRRRAARPVHTHGDLNPVDEHASLDFSEQEYRQLLVRRAMQMMQSEFAASTWQACWEHVVSGRPAADIAADLGMTVNAVYVSKSRVLRRLREELDGLWE